MLQRHVSDIGAASREQTLLTGSPLEVANKSMGFLIQLADLSLTTGVD
jgi:hypothetical protein